MSDAPPLDWNIARSYEKGGVFVWPDGHPRRLYSPETARSLADDMVSEMEEKGVEMDDETEAFIEELREAADDVDPEVDE